MAFESIDHLLAHVEQQPTWRDRRPYLWLCQHWAEVVGAAVANHAQPTGYSRNVLYVAVSGAAWAQTLSFERQRLLAKIADRVPVPFRPPLADVRFSTARWSEVQRSTSSSSSAPRSATPSQATNQVTNQAISQRTSPPAPSQPDGRSPASPDPAPATIAPLDAKTAFDRWAARAKAQAQVLPRCPACDRPTPKTELDRWRVCSPCAIAQQRRQSN